MDIRKLITKNETSIIIVGACSGIGGVYDDDSYFRKFVARKSNENPEGWDVFHESVDMEIWNSETGFISSNKSIYSVRELVKMFENEDGEVCVSIFKGEDIVNYVHDGTFEEVYNTFFDTGKLPEYFPDSKMIFHYDNTVE